jgi:uncharacterized protein (DUF924 family)
MTAAPRRWAAELLHLWFHELEPAQWWGGTDAVDTMLRRRFGRDLDVLGTRPASEFLTDPLTARAAILLFDQIPRNIHRGSCRAFASDPLARRITRGVLARGWDRSLSPQERAFAYMPLMHSEAIADQRDSLAVFASRAPGNLGFARSHHRMIARFGRFPHRNAVLGRRSSSAEQAAVAAGYAW